MCLGGVTVEKLRSALMIYVNSRNRIVDAIIDMFYLGYRASDFRMLTQMAVFRYTGRIPGRPIISLTVQALKCALFICAKQNTICAISDASRGTTFHFAETSQPAEQRSEQIKLNDQPRGTMPQPPANET